MQLEAHISSEPWFSSCFNVFVSICHLCSVECVNKFNIIAKVQYTNNHCRLSLCTLILLQNVRLHAKEIRNGIL